MSGLYYWSIKVTDGEVTLYGEQYTKVLLKDFFYNKKEAKKALLRIRQDFHDKDIKIFHMIRGKWCIVDEI